MCAKNEKEFEWIPLFKTKEIIEYTLWECHSVNRRIIECCNIRYPMLYIQLNRKNIITPSFPFQWDDDKWSSGSYIGLEQYISENKLLEVLGSDKPQVNNLSDIAHVWVQQKKDNYFKTKNNKEKEKLKHFVVYWLIDWINVPIEEAVDAILNEGIFFEHQKENKELQICINLDAFRKKLMWKMEQLHYNHDIRNVFKKGNSFLNLIFHPNPIFCNNQKYIIDEENNDNKEEGILSLTEYFFDINNYILRELLNT